MANYYSASNQQPHSRCTINNDDPKAITYTSQISFRLDSHLSNLLFNLTGRINFKSYETRNNEY